MTFFRSRVGGNVFTMFSLLLWICLLIALPGQYILFQYTKRDECSDSIGHRVLKGARSTARKVTQEVPVQGSSKEKDGTAYESTIFFVPRHKQPKWVPYVPVKNRNKFEALFRDFESLNVVPEDLSDSDKLIKDADKKHHGKPWERFYQDINRYQLYSYNNTALFESLFTYLQTSPLQICQQMPGGTQIKLNMTFSDGGQGLMKPWRVPREYETRPDHYFFADIERHTAEIASFHLDRILDFRRVPPVTGRIFNITSEIKTTAHDKAFRKSFFTSPANNTCFITTCLQYCEASRTPVCGHPDMLEGSVCAFLPKWRKARRKVWNNPWKQSYTRTQGSAPWEKDPNYCQSVVMKDPLYQTGRRMLDVIDMIIFDFFIGNLDRHTYNTFKMFGNFTSFVLYDHGRAFGRYSEDYTGLLSALSQCCVIRRSTYERLLILNREEYLLGDVMRESLSMDPIAPVLYEPFYAALNRRLRTVLEYIDRCLAKAQSPEDVLKQEPKFEDD